jgi:peptide/nickel transport system substrate-binding protein
MVMEQLSIGEVMRAKLSRRRGLAALGAGLFLAACGDDASNTEDAGKSSGVTPGGATESAGTAEPKRGGTLVLGFESDIGPLTVELTSAFVTQRAYRHIYETLVDRDFENFHDVPPDRPALAQSWETDASGLVYTFHLQEGVSFHDGTPFTAEAAKFNFDRLMDPSHPQYYEKGAGAKRSTLGNVEKVDAADANTLRITLKKLDVEFLTRVQGIFMISPKLIEQYGNEDYHRYSGGTGPFKLVSNEQGQQAVLERNADYWGKDRFDGGPFVDKIVIKFLVEPAVRVAALQSGEVDWIAAVPPDSVGSLEDSFNVAMESYPHIWLWVMNFKNDLFKDLRVRQAVALAIDRETLAQKLLQDTAIAAYQIWGPGSPAYRPVPEQMRYGYDPERAKKLLQEAGYSNGIDVKMLSPNGGSGMLDPILINQFIQENLADVGIKLNIEIMEWQSFFAKWREGLTPDFSAYTMSFPTETITSLPNFVFTKTQPPNGVNTGWYSNPEADSMLEKAAVDLDESSRAETYQKVVDLITQDVEYLSVVHDKAPLAWAKKVHGFIHPKSWNYSFNKTWLDS